MDFSTIGIILLVVAAIAFFIFRRGRTQPQGTYDDPKVSSSGSIGGGPRAHDDPKVHSGGSIGGGPRANNSRDVSSGGSIGRQSTEREGANRRPSTGVRDDNRFDDDNDERDNDGDGNRQPTHNDRTLKSGGSFGSS